MKNRKKGFDKMTTYYVVIGQMITPVEWKQKYLVPFDTEEEAIAYRDNFLANHKGYFQAFIACSSGHTELMANYICQV
jgi:hypothetical protein